METGLIDPVLAADLLERRDPDRFGDALLGAAQSLGGAEEMFAYRIDAGGHPVRIAASSGLRDLDERTGRYQGRFHTEDPAVTARERTVLGSGFECRVMAEEIASRDYRRICFERPRFVEKHCFGWRGSAYTVVLSFYRRRGDTAGVRKLTSLAQVALVALSQMAERVGEGGILAELNRRLSAAEVQLSERERAVCSRSLAGRTAREIAEELGIGASTVLTYRQRAYRKLGCSRAADLIGLILH